MQIDEAYAELNIVQDLIPIGNSNRPGTKLVPTGITIHNTDNPNKGANAAAHAKYQKGAVGRTCALRRTGLRRQSPHGLSW
jgi:N-acetylmuramoyl-L-alanine amidase CwlA